MRVGVEGILRLKHASSCSVLVLRLLDKGMNRMVSHRSQCGQWSCAVMLMLKITMADGSWLMQQRPF